MALALAAAPASAQEALPSQENVPAQDGATSPPAVSSAEEGGTPAPQSAQSMMAEAPETSPTLNEAAAPPVAALLEEAGATALQSTPSAAETVTPEISPTLQGLLETTLSTHPQVEAARASARSAGFDLKTARWQRFPNVSVEALEALQQRSSSIYNKFYPTLNVEQPLWTGGRLSGILKQARFTRNAAFAFYESTVLQTALDVVDAYHETLRSARRSSLLELSRDRHQAMEETIERRVAADVSPAADLELARARLAQINQQVTLAQAQYQVALERLREFVGDPELSVPPQLTAPAIWPSFQLGTTLEEAKIYSPRLRQLRGEADASGADVKIARAAMMPQVSGQYVYNDFQGARAGVVLRLQTGSGLSRLTTLSSARERQRSSDLKILAAERELRNRITAEYTEFSSSVARLADSLRASDAAERVRQSYLRQFISGRRSWLDVMNSFQETTSADIALADTQSSAQSSMDRLMLLTGRWRLDIKDPSK